LIHSASLSACKADGARRYSDDEYEYRHVQLPKQMLKVIPKDYFDARGTLRLLWEEEWRALGITQVWICADPWWSAMVDTDTELGLGALRSP
jgi:hypothetical protein